MVDANGDILDVDQRGVTKRDLDGKKVRTVKPYV